MDCTFIVKCNMSGCGKDANLVLFAVWLLSVLHYNYTDACGPDNFMCIHSKECVKLQFVCDGTQDCHDNTDEKHCPEVTRTHPGQNGSRVKVNPGKPQPQAPPPQPGDSDWKCPHNLFTCKNKECISKKSQCDGVPHCSDKSDEENCSNFRDDAEEEVGEDFECPHRLFTCKNKECVVPTERCNGTPLCSDESDEWNCKYSADKKTKHGRGKTKKGKVGVKDSKVSASKVKPVISSKGNKDHQKKKSGKAERKADNGKPDGNSVNMCNMNLNRAKQGGQQFGFKHFFPCGSGMFTCENGQCINEKKRCNGHKECQDGSDELGCVISEGVKVKKSSSKVQYV